MDIKTSLIIVAAGTGSRFGHELPKQFAAIAGKPLLAWAISAWPKVDRIVVVLNNDQRENFEKMVTPQLSTDAKRKLLPLVEGGVDRQGSVHNGLLALDDFAPQIVLIHDAARGMMPGHVFDAVASSAQSHGAAFACQPVVDSLHRVAQNQFESAIDRSEMRIAQTPQGFDYQKILQIHNETANQTKSRATDDIALAAQHGLRGIAVQGDALGTKVTYPQDVAIINALLESKTMSSPNDNPAYETRTGIGYDTHTQAKDLSDGCLILNGVRFEDVPGLIGHSDADVAMHALTDAILGAIGAGDIGVHFPPSDPQWRGASSDQFLKHAIGLVREQQGMLVNCDMTIICEAPKITPVVDQMKRNLAAILDVEQTRINIKATTNERMGFIGRGEGIVALATASVRLMQQFDSTA